MSTVEIVPPVAVIKVGDAGTNELSSSCVGIHPLVESTKTKTTLAPSVLIFKVVPVAPFILLPFLSIFKALLSKVNA